MPVLKPIRGIRQNKRHPLVSGLVGHWPFNEKTGETVFDLSGNGNTGEFVGNPNWQAGKHGASIYFDGNGDYIKAPFNQTLNLTEGITLHIWINFFVAFASQAQYARLIDRHHNYRLYLFNSGLVTFEVYDSSNSIHYIRFSNISWQTNRWYLLTVTYDTATFNTYIDGVYDNSKSDAFTIYSNETRELRIGAYNPTLYGLNGKIDHVMIFNRALSSSEIALLYREPFCMFDRAWRPGLIGGQIVELAGTSAALSFLSATAKAMRKVGGTVASTSDVTAVLSSIRGLTASTGGFTAVDGSLGIMGESPPEMERNWLREALFNGMTANAFKLGTSLSLGWFWVRVAGCSVLYRGAGMGEIDFANILAVSEKDAREISPPSYIPHNNGSTYFYVVRRFNNCGYQERTLAAAVRISIESNGDLAEPQPNNISSSKAKQIDNNKIQLVWFYYSLAQKSQPVSFNVYYDDRTGQINYQNPLATIDYKGRKFYSFQSSALEAGKYLFAIRAEDAGGIENSSLARLRIQLDTASPDAVDILSVEGV